MTAVEGRAVSGLARYHINRDGYVSLGKLQEITGLEEGEVRDRMERLYRDGLTEEDKGGQARRLVLNGRAVYGGEILAGYYDQAKEEMDVVEDVVDVKLSRMDVLKNPETRFGCQTYGLSPFFVTCHSKRQNNAETERLEMGKESLMEVSFDGKKNPALKVEVEEDVTRLERTIRFEFDENDYENGPYSWERYMNRVFNRVDVLRERTERIEGGEGEVGIAELGARMVQEGERTEGDIMEMIELEGEILSGTWPSDYDRNDPFLRKLDSFIHEIKGTDGPFSRVKKAAMIGTGYSERTFVEPARESLREIENGFKRRLEAGV